MKIKENIERLTQHRIKITVSNSDQEYRELSSDYNMICNAIQFASEATKRDIASAIENALVDANVDTLGMYFLDAALFRAQISDYGNWSKIGTNALIPKPALFDCIDKRIEFASKYASPYCELYKGVKCFIAGNDEGAFRHFVRAKEDPLFWSAVRDDLRGAATCGPLPTLVPSLAFQHPFRLCSPEERFPTPTGPLTWRLRPELGGSCRVITFSCDDLYFQAFAPLISNSLPDECVTLNLHFHIINMSCLSMKIITDLQNCATKKHFTLFISCEETAACDRAYFACARFIRLHEFLEAFKVPILLLDADLEFVGDPREWIKLLVPDAVNMLFVKGPWDDGFLPWRAVWGGMVYVPPNEEGNYFAKVLQWVVGKMWNIRSPTNWWIDQNALYITYRMLQRYWGPDGFRDIRPEVHQQIRSSEGLKIGRLLTLPQVAQLVARGVDWHEALTKIQLRHG